MSNLTVALLASAAALCVGIVVGFLLAGGGPARVRNALKGAAAKLIVPVSVIGVAAGVIAATVWAANELGGSDQLWGQIVSAVSLVVVTLLLFATGPNTYTVTRDFPVQTGQPERHVGDVLTKAEYDAATTNQDRVRVQRGLYFRRLYVGMDGRWSTSKLQALLWTYVFLYALIALFVADELGLDAGELKDGFGNLEWQEQYFLLLGGPFVAAVGAKAITTNKVQEGTVPKPPADEAGEQDPGQGLREVISDDDGRTDLGDFQFFMFNVVALAVFLAAFIPHLEKGLPKLPDFLVALTSAAALAYLGKKAVERKTPKVAMLVPGKARVGDRVTIEGTYLPAAPREKPTITVDGVLVPPGDVTITRDQRVPGDVVALKAKVPSGVSTGTDKIVCVRPRGASAAAPATIEIVESAISSVEPGPVVWAPGSLVTIKGMGFGLAEGEVELGDVKLQVADWTDTQIRATLPKQIGDQPQDQVTVKVKLPGQAEGRAYPVELAGRPMTPATADPTPVPLRPGSAVTITGTGFGSHPAPSDEAKVTLGELQLTVASWNDTTIVATLPSDVTLAADRTGTKLELSVRRKGRIGESLSVDVVLPQTTVAEITPTPVIVRQGERVFLSGAGFGAKSDPAQPEVRIGSMTLTVTDRTDTLLIAALPTDAATFADGMIADITEQLIVKREGWKEAIKPVGLKKP